jgi:hypothetical protein
MFPIPSNQRLSFTKVADYWSREVEPHSSPHELLNELAKAWWRGDLIANGANRADVLRAIYNYHPAFVAFAFPDFDPPQTNELPHGSVEMLWLFRVPLPNSQPETWDDNNCTMAFHAVADAWDRKPDVFEICFPILKALELTQAEFSRWIDSQGKPVAIFWASGEKEEHSLLLKKLPEKRAIKLAQDYFSLTSGKGQSPTQIDFEKWARSTGVVGNRDILRGVFKKMAGPLRRGPPAKRV